MGGVNKGFRIFLGIIILAEVLLLPGRSCRAESKTVIHKLLENGRNPIQASKVARLFFVSQVNIRDIKDAGLSGRISCLNLRDFRRDTFRTHSIHIVASDFVPQLFIIQFLTYLFSLNSDSLSLPQRLTKSRIKEATPADGFRVGFFVSIATKGGKGYEGQAEL